MPIQHSFVMYTCSVGSLRAQRTGVRKGTPGKRLYPSGHRDFRGFLNSPSPLSLRRVQTGSNPFSENHSFSRGVSTGNWFWPAGVYLIEKPLMSRSGTGEIKRSLSERTVRSAERESRNRTGNEDTGFSRGAPGRGALPLSLVPFFARTKNGTC